MLKRLYIDNVRGLTNFEFRPEQVAVLVGPNGGGKTSVYLVLAALQSFLSGEEAQRAFPAVSLTRWETRRVQRFELEGIGAHHVHYSYSLDVSHSPDGTRSEVKEERLTANGQLLYRLADGEVQLFDDNPASGPPTTFPFKATRSFLPMLEPSARNELIVGFRRWTSGIWLFSLRPHTINANSDGEAGALSYDGSNFVGWYRRLFQEQPRIRDALLRELAPVIPGLREISLYDAGQNVKVLRFECDVAKKSFPLLLGELSDGQRALLVLYAIKHAIANRASLLMFDEPDNYLAQREIQPWLSSMRDAVSSATATLLVISHHPEVIDYLAPDQVLKLWRAEEGPTRIEAVKFNIDAGMSASEALLLEAP